MELKIMLDKFNLIYYNINRIEKKINKIPQRGGRTEVNR